MPDDRDQSKTFTRRSALLLGTQGVLFGALVWRMYDLQVRDSKKFRLLAEENRINNQLLVPPRGRIVDRFGVPLAINRDDYRAVIVAERAKDVDRVLRRLSHIVPIDDEEIADIKKAIRRSRRFLPVTIRKELNWAEVSQIEVNAPDLPGVFIEEGLSRTYPHRGEIAHVIGYVGPVNEAEKAKDSDPLMTLPEFRVGKNGIERSYDKALRGRAGARQVEINASGRVQRELARRDGESGQDIAVTLDLELQKFANRRLAQHRSAAAVVIDIENGDILTMACHPSYDPNLFIGGIKARIWKSLSRDPATPLINKAISGTYAPGSTFKMLVALAGLEHNIITPNSAFYCPGHFNLGRARFHCWRRGGHGYMNVKQAIKQSCDVFFYETAMKLGVERIRAMALKLGLGERIGIDLPSESPGLIPSLAWKRKQFRDKWHPGETAITGIGQGYVLTTPLQLAVMTARLATGKAVEPRLFRGLYEEGKGVDSGNAAPTFTDLGFNPKKLDHVLEGMRAVTNEPGGTAYWTRIMEEEYRMAGKTGTSQVRRITRAERARGVLRNDQLPWERRDHALFVGYAPLDKPRYACAVLVEHGGSGSRAAAPIAKDILREAQIRKSGAPSRQAAAVDTGTPKTARN